MRRVCWFARARACIWIWCLKRCFRRVRGKRKEKRKQRLSIQSVHNFWKNQGRKWGRQKWRKEKKENMKQAVRIEQRRKTERKLAYRQRTGRAEFSQCRDGVSVTSIVTSARPRSSGAAAGTVAVRSCSRCSFLFSSSSLFFLPSSESVTGYTHWQQTETWKSQSWGRKLCVCVVADVSERERPICWDSKQSSHFKWAEFTFEL